jgi:glutamate racemase
VAPDRILLACTHYPLLLPAIERIVAAARVSLSAPTEILVQGDLVAARLAAWMARHPEMTARLSQGGTRRFATTDDPQWFAARAAALLGREITAERVHLPAVS